MSADFLKSGTEHIAKDYYLDLHEAMSQCQTQMTSALRRHRLKKETKFTIWGAIVTLEQVTSAVELFMDPRQAPHFEMNLFKKENAVVRKVIHDLEIFLIKVQKIIEGMKIPKRPPEVDEWIKKTE